MSERCRHRKTWLLSGGHLLWCYECGAIRQMQVSIESNSVDPFVDSSGKKSRFIKPVGKNGENPHKKLLQR